MYIIKKKSNSTIQCTIDDSIQFDTSIQFVTSIQIDNNRSNVKRANVRHSSAPAALAN